MVNNKEVRAEIYKAGFRHWEVAEKVGVSDCSFSVWLRHELTPERKERILRAIDELKKENANG